MMRRVGRETAVGREKWGRESDAMSRDSNGERKEGERK